MTENLDSCALPQESATLRYEYFLPPAPCMGNLPTGSLLASGSVPLMTPSVFTGGDERREDNHDNNPNNAITTSTKLTQNTSTRKKVRRPPHSTKTNTHISRANTQPVGSGSIRLVGKILKNLHIDWSTPYSWPLQSLLRSPCPLEGPKTQDQLVDDSYHLPYSLPYF